MKAIFSGELSFGVGFEPDIYIGEEDLRELLQDFFVEHRSDLGERDSVPVRLTVEVQRDQA